jgi:ectoine hydroxylase-related dioxygenase (phytanoyl-CoA dioxygenase family)
LIDRKLSASDAPQATEICKNDPIYDMARLRARLEESSARRALLTERAQVFLAGSGVVLWRGAFTDISAIDDATVIFDHIIKEEKAASGGNGDHFAAAGANDRIWNTLQKVCGYAPDVFPRYFANAAIEAACEAWPRDDSRTLFERRHIQFPSAKGKALFFNPALVHAAGANTRRGNHRMPICYRDPRSSGARWNRSTATR